MTYRQRIAELAPQYDPRHIEALMRVEHSTLDKLSESAFIREVKFCCLCVDEGGLEQAERIAKSFGM